MEMRKVIVLLIVMLAGCEPEENTPTAPVDDNFDPSLATKLSMGNFVGVAGHTVSGMAATYEAAGRKIVYFEPFTSQNGPDLRVYLSKDANAGSFINLGRLKSTSGMQSYEIPGNPNLEEYPYVVIWCQQFSVGFGIAQMN